MLLYKYRQFNNQSLQNLEQSTLWCSDLRSFNDPYEAQFVLEATQPGEFDDLYDHWRREFPDQTIYRKTIRFDAADVLRNARNRYGVCCFSELPDSVQMWGYYAASHGGFCLAFEFPESSDDTISQADLHKVKYRYGCATFPVTKFLRSTEVINKSMLKLVTTKHAHWKHEKEWRFINSKPNSPIKYQPSTLKEVIIGAKANPADTGKLRELCSRNYPHVKVRQFMLMHGTYRLQLADEYEIPDIG